MSNETDEDSILMIVEDTEKMLAKLPGIEMAMAMTLAKRQNFITWPVDMKLEKDFCEECVLYQVPHYHLIGTLR